VFQCVLEIPEVLAMGKNEMMNDEEKTGSAVEKKKVRG
jgi:hypothetical protein